MKSLLGGVGSALIKNQMPIDFVSRLFQLPSAAGSSSTRALKSTSSVGTLFSIINRLSTAVSSVEWCLYRKSASGDPAKRTKVTRHLALDVWNQPNPFMSRPEFVESVEQHIDLTGEMWWIVVTDPRAPTLPIGIWPVRPDRMEPVPDAMNYISHYNYLSPDGTRVRLELNQVIFIKMPNPYDPFRGLGPVQSILADLDSVKYSAEWNRNFFINGAVPGGIIKVGKRLSDNEFEELQLRWDEQHRGVANAYRVAILENAEFVPVSYTNKDMQFVELRGVSREVIREAFGIPKFAVGDVDDVNRATADASAAWFGAQLTVPRLERIKGALNHRFLPLFGPGTDQLEFDYESPVDSDYERDNAVLAASVDAWTKLVAAGVDPSEASQVCGLPEMTVTKPEPPAPPEPPPGQEGDSPPAEPPANRGRAVGPKGVRAQLSEETDAQIQKDADRMATDWERRLTNLLVEWDGISAQQFDEIVEQIRQAVANNDIEKLAELGVTTSGAVALLVQYMTDMSEDGAAQIVAAARRQEVDGVEAKTVEHTILAAAGSTVVALLASGLCDSAAKKALQLWGSSTDADEVARQVRQHLHDLGDRALRDQLGGALMNAMNRGRFATMLTAPTAVWYATERNDRSACGPCRDIDETQFHSLEAADLAYPNGGYVKCEGGVRCRGAVVPVWVA